MIQPKLYSLRIELYFSFQQIHQSVVWQAYPVHAAGCIQPIKHFGLYVGAPVN
jgi:hypothetical protein